MQRYPAGFSTRDAAVALCMDAQTYGMIHRIPDNRLFADGDVWCCLTVRQTKARSDVVLCVL